MQKNQSRFLILTIISFFVLTLLNRTMVTSQLFNPGMNLYDEALLVSLNALLGDFGLLLLMAGLVYVFTKRKTTFVIVLSILGIGLSALVFSLKIYSFYYGTAFSFFNARTFSNSAPVLGQQLTLHLWKNLFRMNQYIAVIPAFIFIYFIVRTIYKKPFKTDKFFNKSLRKTIHSYNILLAGLLMVGFSQFNYYNMVDDTFYEENRVALKGVQSMGLYNYYLTDLISYTIIPEPETNDIDENLKSEMDAFLANAQLDCPLNYKGEETCNNSEVTGLFEGKKLVILQLESLNNFLINLNIDVESESYPVTPFLNELTTSNEVLYFDHFYSQIGVGKTSDAEFATLTGLSPTGQIVTYFDFIQDNYETIASLFKAKDFQTYGLNGSTETFYKRNENYTRLGFHEANFIAMERLAEEGYYDFETETINGWVDDPVIFDYLRDLLEKDEQQFIFALTVILHTPYFDFDGITAVNPWEDVIERDLGNYLDYAKRSDEYYQAFFESLSEDILNDTVFLLYGDHTAGLTMDDLSQLYPDLTHIDYQQIQHNVAFMIYAPGMDLSVYNVDITKVRGQSDIKRTVANLFNLDEQYKFGVDMLSDADTFTYNPMTMDLFTDEYHMIMPSKWINNEDYLADIEAIEAYFYQHKKINDALLKYHYFDQP